MQTYLQKYSPRGDERQVPPFLHGDGEHDTKPEITYTFSICGVQENITIL